MQHFLLISRLKIAKMDKKNRQIYENLTKKMLTWSFVFTTKFISVMDLSL